MYIIDCCPEMCKAVMDGVFINIWEKKAYIYAWAPDYTSKPFCVIEFCPWCSAGIEIKEKT